MTGSAPPSPHHLLAMMPYATALGIELHEATLDGLTVPVA
jgi:hypothetical protein